MQKEKIKVKKKYSAFLYKAGNSFLHRCPAWIKLLCIPALNILFLCLPVYFALGLIVVQFAIACVLRFSLREQFTDLKPVLYYAAFVLVMDLIMCFGSGKMNFAEVFSWDNQKESVFLLVKIFCILQSASLVFKTSTSLELRDGIWTIEKAVRKIFHLKEKNFITNTISLFLNFIPMVSKIWNQSVRAWIARGGKKGIKMYHKLLPVLFFVGMKKAWNAARALQIRN